MKILTLNCFLVPLLSPSPKTRIKLIAKKINEINPDLVFLQEVPLKSHKEELIKLLSKYNYNYITHGGLLKMGGGLCFFSKFPITEKKFYEFSKSGYWTDMSFLDKLAGKGFMKLKIQAGNQVYYCFHAHLTCNYKNDYSKNNKGLILIKQQIKEIAKEIRKISLANPCFIIGDLNMHPGTKIYKDFMKKTKAEDISLFHDPSFIGKPSKIRKYFDKSCPGKLDYIFYRGQAKINYMTNYVYNENEFLSDHKGILTEIKI